MSTNTETQRRLEEKWGREMMEAGFTVIPNAILEYQHLLGLDSVDLAIIAHLCKHWWRHDEPPYPSKRRIAQALKLDPRTVQRHIAALEKHGLIKRETRMDAQRGQRTNQYVLTGLRDKARPYAEQMLDERRKSRERRKLQRKAGLRPTSVVDENADESEENES